MVQKGSKMTDLICFLDDKKINRIIDKALREHYRETMGKKRVPSDYLLMFTEGGAANAIASAIAAAQHKRSEKWMKERYTLR